MATKATKARATKATTTEPKATEATVATEAVEAVEASTTTATKEYTGHTEAMFQAWRSGSLEAELAKATKASKLGLTDEQEAEVSAFEATIAELGTATMAELATTTDLAEATTVIAEANQAVAAHNMAIADIQIVGAKLAFEAAMAATEIPLRLKAVGGTTKHGFGKHVYRVTAFKASRYYLADLEADTVSVYDMVADKANLVMTIAKASYPSLYPSSMTAIQRLHYLVYAPITKTFEAKADRLEAANRNWHTWDTAIGLGSKNTNGSNSTVELEASPVDWLKANLPTKAVTATE